MGLVPVLAFLLACLFKHQISVLSHHESSELSSRIAVVGVVYCDTCSINTFSRKSYFLPGVEVHITCKYKANAPKTAEEVNISVNRTTDRTGIYKLEIPNVNGVNCVGGVPTTPQCQASLVRSVNRACGIPVFRTSTNQISVKSKRDKLCIYSLSALSYRPSRRNNILCGKKKP